MVLSWVWHIRHVSKSERRRGLFRPRSGLQNRVWSNWTPKGTPNLPPMSSLLH
jgi:hypothetical protein